MTTDIVEVPTMQPWNNEQVNLIKQQLAPGISDAELQHFAMICQKTGLDPFLKQIYAIMRNAKQGEQWIKKMTVQTGIDGYRLIADRTGKYAGSDEPEFDADSATHPKWARVTVWKMVQGQRCPFSAKIRWDEYVQKDKQGNPTDKWKTMPYLMLAKCAESLALRKAFPADLSGVYTSEEMAQADNEYLAVTVTENGNGHKPAITAPTNNAVKPPENKPAIPLTDADLAARIDAKAATIGLSREEVKRYIRINQISATRAGYEKVLKALSEPETACKVWGAGHLIAESTIAHFVSQQSMTWDTLYQKLTSEQARSTILDLIAPPPAQAAILPDESYVAEDAF